MKIAHGLLCLLLLGSASPIVSERKDAAIDITVRLFSAHLVQSITLLPTGASGSVFLQRCASCAKSPLVAGITIESSTTPATMTVDGKPLTRLALEGPLRVQAQDGASAAGAGRWMIWPAKDGLHVLVTMPSEHYVMAVLASEAAVDEPAESLKALAVVARSFALSNPHRHREEGLCDSTHCQALRLAAVPERIATAVHATAGETLWSRGARVPGYFTQSCGGMTADASEVWGGARKPWLIAQLDPFDQPSAWHVSVGASDMREALAREGWKLPVVEGVRVVQASEANGGGRARKVEVEGGGQRVVIDAASFRFAINRSLGWNTLRSDWYSVNAAPGKFVFEGKGFGHGVGLCQFGAAQRARKGQSYREMLAFYFPGTTVRIDADDQGWRKSEGAGWTLATTEAPKILAAGNAAWARAQQLLPAVHGVHPLVSVYPTTELFRQSMNEPGWVLAATRGETIGLQPAAVVTRHGGWNELLLHEFLHVLVEQRATDATPLWLREGLVEALAGETCDAAAMTPVQIDAALVHAGTQQQADNAHRAACSMVRRLVEAKGLPVVVGWLRSSVPASVAAAGK